MRNGGHNTFNKSVFAALGAMNASATMRRDEVHYDGAIAILVVLSRNSRGRLWPDRSCCLSDPAPDRRGKGCRRYHVAACQLRYEALGRSRVPPRSQFLLLRWAAQRPR